ncbi:hypothetical protein TNCV_1838181 [Trichonephila clavipes]|nr:hypothetical protein TNCV_1838181 [Trichonephila clavipes]
MPAYSFDLSPIENVWSILAQRLDRDTPSAATPDQLWSTISQRSHLTDSEAWRNVGRLTGGQAQAEIAQAIGVSQSVIYRIWNRFLETESAGQRPGQGRRRATTSNEDR